MQFASPETLEKIVAAMKRTFRVPSSFQICPETTSADIDGWDSLSHAVLIMNVEQEFGIEIPLDKAYALPNVGALAAVLEQLSDETSR